MYKNTKEKEPNLGLPFFIADKNLVEVWGVFIQDGVLHVKEEAPVNLNQVLHGKNQNTRGWRHPPIALLFLGHASRRGTYWNVDKDAINFCSGDEFLQRIQEILERREKCQEQKGFNDAGADESETFIISGLCFTFILKGILRECTSFFIYLTFQGPGCIYKWRSDTLLNESQFIVCERLGDWYLAQGDRKSVV